MTSGDPVDSTRWPPSCWILPEVVIRIPDDLEWRHLSAYRIWFKYLLPFHAIPFPQMAAAAICRDFQNSVPYVNIRNIKNYGHIYAYTEFPSWRHKPFNMAATAMLNFTGSSSARQMWYRMFQQPRTKFVTVPEIAGCFGFITVVLRRLSITKIDTFICCYAFIRRQNYPLCKYRKRKITIRCTYL